MIHKRLTTYGAVSLAAILLSLNAGAMNNKNGKLENQKQVIDLKQSVKKEEPNKEIKEEKNCNFGCEQKKYEEKLEVINTKPRKTCKIKGGQESIQCKHKITDDYRRKIVIKLKQTCGYDSGFKITKQFPCGKIEHKENDYDWKETKTSNENQNQNQCILVKSEEMATQKDENKNIPIEVYEEEIVSHDHDNDIEIIRTATSSDLTEWEDGEVRDLSLEECEALLKGNSALKVTLQQDQKFYGMGTQKN